MWDLSSPIRIEPESPALQGGFLTTGPPVKVKVAQVCPTLCNPWTIQSMNSPGQNTGVGNHSLLQGIFPAQGSNSGLLYCRQILYQLNHQGCQGFHWTTREILKLNFKKIMLLSCLLASLSLTLCSFFSLSPSFILPHNVFLCKRSYVFW